MNALKIIAGQKAQKIIRDHGGLTPDMIRVVLAASGGPKWLVLRGLDDYIFGEWLLNSCVPKDLVGSSIGAMRLSLAATADPRQAFQDWIDDYLAYDYHKNLTIDQHSDDIQFFFKKVIHADRVKAILENPHRRLNIIATRCHGLAGHPTSVALNIVGMLSAQIKNLMSRASLNSDFDRVIFSVPSSQLPTADLMNFNCKQAVITQENFYDIIMASGSIPGVWRPVIDIAGAPKGVYRDGGITDYHFANKWDLVGSDKDRLVLYPHFYDHIIPGWFDKPLKSRRMQGENWDNLVLLCPSDDFVASLPDGRITDRKDFTDFSNYQRRIRWNTVINNSFRLAEEFEKLVNNGGDFIDRMQLPAYL